MLGPLEVQLDGGTAVRVAGARLRTLLIVLALEPGKLVPTARIVDAIWGDDPPAGVANALQALVSRLRRTLPGVSVESLPAGYRLDVKPDAVDVARFERLAASGRSALAEDPVSAARTLSEALQLWRGPALLDVADVEYFRGPVVHLTQLRLAATQDRIEADLRLGRGAELVTELTTLVAEHPLQERLAGLLMRALVAADRPAEALTVYAHTREALADQLGTDPSPALSDLHAALLRGELDAAPPPPAPREDHAPRTNLRAGLTSFIGRDDDVVAIGTQLGEHRLTTLTGPGGSGKTRLATEVARTMVGRIPDGVWLVELASVADGADLPSAVLAAMDLRDALITRESAEDPVDRLAAALRPQAALLVLDNCEHVIDASATLADQLLGRCPRLRILATSREPLGITGEAVWPVEPLALPPADAAGANVMSYDAVRLLADRAQAARRGFTVTDDAAPTLVRICRALDGMPLAIELAAARLRTMSPPQLADRLDDRFRVLTGGSRTAVPRHQTLRAVVDWSWELLSDGERVLLRRLAVFAGGATVEAAERVCAGDGIAAGQVLDLLAALTDKSLLVTDAAAGAPRYRLLETIKAYGLERLDEAGERGGVRRAHTAYFTELAETAEPYLRRAEQLVWLRRLRADHDNINAALRGAIAADDAQTAMRLVVAAGWYWWLGGHKAEGIEMTIEALGIPGEVDDEVRATACAMVAYFTTAGLGDLRQAERWIRTAQQLAEGLDHPGPVLRYAGTIGAALDIVLHDGGFRWQALEPLLADDDPWVRAQTRLAHNRMLGPAEREADIEKALADFRTIGERWGICIALTVLADLAARRGDLSRALDYCEQAVALITEMGTVEDLVLIRAKQAQLYWLVGDAAGSTATMAQAARDAEHVGWPDALAMMAFFKADLARWSGDTTTARAELDRADAMLRDITVDPVFRAMVLDSLAYLDAANGDLDMAGARRAEALAVSLDSRDEQLMGQVLVGIADHAVRQGRPDEAARLLAASEAMTGGLDQSRPDAARVETAARAAVGEQELTEAIASVREELAAAAEGGALATVEAVRKLAASVLGT